LAVRRRPVTGERPVDTQLAAEKSERRIRLAAELARFRPDERLRQSRQGEWRQQPGHLAAGQFVAKSARTRGQVAQKAASARDSASPRVVRSNSRPASRASSHGHKRLHAFQTLRRQHADLTDRGPPVHDGGH
jgi:hypothetical protein